MWPVQPRGFEDIGKGWGNTQTLDVEFIVFFQA